MEGSSLPKPQPVIIPSFTLEGEEVFAGFNRFPTDSFELSPFLPVPVSYQWQITSIYLPMLCELVTAKSAEAALTTASIGVSARLLRDGQVVWIAQTMQGLQRIGLQEEKAGYSNQLLLSEDFNNPIVVSPASRLVLEIEGTAAVGLPEGKEIKIGGATIWSGTQRTRTPPVFPPPANSILHYSLYTGA